MFGKLVSFPETEGHHPHTSFGWGHAIVSLSTEQIESDAATNGRTITVFGGTGFLGNRIVRHLRARGFRVRIASRHPDRGTDCLVLMIRNLNP